MNSLPDTAAIADTIRTIYEQDVANGASAIEIFVNHELSQFSEPQKQQTIKNLVSHFSDSQLIQPPSSPFDDDQLLRFCSLLLGYPVNAVDLKAEALQLRLTEALTIIFETLNQLIRTINLTLLDDGQNQETIRFLIGEQLDGSRDDTSLKEQLDKIQTAFVTSHRAFKMAMQDTVKKILTELDPDTITGNSASGAKFNPLRKFDDFNRYKKSYKQCQQWVDSGRCMESFLRNFEKQCATMAKNPMR